jgi:3-dehydroquinate synthase
LCQNDLNDFDIIKLAINKSVKLKAKIVSQDEKEHGVRAALNYGHTFGHVIEKETNYKHYLHGETVGIGMVMANKLALKLNQIDEKEYTLIFNLISKYDIPTYYKICDIDSFYEDFFLDKKSTDGKLKFILPNKIGKFKIKDDISKESIIEVLQEFTS